MTTLLIDPEEIYSTYKKTDWFDVACTVAVAAFIGYIIARFVATVVWGV